MTLNQFRSIDLTWDRANGRIYEAIRVASSDENGRKLTVRVSNGSLVEDLSSATLNLYWETTNAKNKGLDAFEVVDASRGIFEIYFTTGMLSNVGKLYAWLQLVDTAGTVTSERFDITVFRGIDTDAAESENSFTALTMALVRVNNIGADINDLDVKKADKVALATTNTEVAKKADKIYVDNRIANVTQGGPADTFNSLSALQSAYPNGTNKPMLVLESDGVTAYVYTWTGNTWKKGVLYQSQGISDRSVEKRKLKLGLIDVLRGDNLVAYDNITYDAYISYTTGEPVASANSCYVTVPIDPTKEYQVTGTNQQLCFKDGNNNYISGFIDVTSITSIPVNARYWCQVCKKEELETLYIGLKDAANKASYIIDDKAIAENSIPPAKIKIPAFVPAEFNLFDKTKVKLNTLLNVGTGGDLTNASFITSDFIDIDPRVKLTTKGDVIRFAAYDALGFFIDAKHEVNLADYAMPSNARKIRLCFTNNQLDLVKLKPVQAIDPDWINTDASQKISDLLNLGIKTIYSVKKDGTGDYTSLRQAIENCGNDAVIEIYDDFSLTDEYTQAELKSNNFVGFPLQKNQTLKGVGDVTLFADMPREFFTESEIVKTSTIHAFSSGNLENLTIIANSVRYAFHVDARAVQKVHCKSVRFIKQNSGIFTSAAVGGGIYSSQHHTYKDCTFETQWTGQQDISIGYHTFNKSDEEIVYPAKLDFTDCNFKTVNSIYELRLGGMRTGVKNIVNLIGNRLNNVQIKEEIYASGSGIDFKIRGRGNRPLTFKVSNSNASNPPIFDFVEEIEIMY